MAEESILEKAIGFIPGVGKSKPAKKPATTQIQLATLKRNLAKLLSDVEKLSGLIAGKKKPARRPAATATRIKAGATRPKAASRSKAGRKSAKVRA